jgi:site-specific DNA-cytosine methylase
MEDALVSVNGPSHTVTSNNLRWAWKSPETGRMEFKIISPFECALLQCFPSEYRFPDCGKANTQRMVGNALPPVVATRFLANPD